MKWDSYLGGVVLGLLHILASWLALVAGFALVVCQTGEPASILVLPRCPR